MKILQKFEFEFFVSKKTICVKPCFVVPDAALVLHPDVVGVDLVPGQSVEGAVVGAALEDAAAGVVSGKKQKLQTKM